MQLTPSYVFGCELVFHSDTPRAVNAGEPLTQPSPRIWGEGAKDSDASC
jgi:hypothetical protein